MVIKKEVQVDDGITGTRYLCEKCNTEYKTYLEADNCEGKHRLKESAKNPSQKKLGIFNE